MEVNLEKGREKGEITNKNNGTTLNSPALKYKYNQRYMFSLDL